MDDRFLDKVQAVLVWIAMVSIAFLVGILIAALAIEMLVPKDTSVKAEITTVGEHDYIVFSDGDDIVHIEHSPDCDCFNIDLE